MLNKYFLCISLLLLFVSICFSQTTQWRLLWDPNTESDMYYYKIFRDTHSASTTLIDTTMHPHTEYIDTGIVPGVRYYYRLKAVDSSGLESDYSAEVSAAIPNIINIPEQIENQGKNMVINLNNFVNDPDHDDSEIEWAHTGNSELSISISTSKIATVTPSSESWYGSETVSFTATDPDEFFDIAAVTLSFNALPVVNAIPNQTINQGGLFATINLDNFVTDPDNDDSEIIWSAEGNSNLNVNISSNRIAAISTPSPNWYGQEIITFIADDSHGGSDNVSVIFTVNGKPQITRSNPIDQIIMEGENFKPFDLDDYVSDPDNTDNELTWQISGNIQLSVSIDSEHIVTVNKPSSDWIGSESIVFIVSDPLGCTNSDTATFASLPEGAINALRVLDISDQTIVQGQSFEEIDLDNFVDCDNSLKPELTWTCTGNTNLQITISSDRIASISVVNANWFGQETITFQAKTPNGISDETNAIFTVRQNIFSSLNFHLLGSGTTVEIRWFTILPVESKILYGIDELNKSSQQNSSYDMEHTHIISNLNPNTIYTFQAVGVDSSSEEYFSLLQTFETGSENSVNVFPNPYTAGQYPENDVVSFSNIPQGSTIQIYNFLGEPVFKQKDINNFYRWAVVNDHNEDVQAGLYLYVVKGPDNKKLASGKIAIIR
jgi:hypothetical protein